MADRISSVDVDQRVGDRVQRRVFDGGAQRLQLAGGTLGGRAGLVDRYGGGGHRPYRLRSPVAYVAVIYASTK